MTSTVGVNKTNTEHRQPRQLVARYIGSVLTPSRLATSRSLYLSLALYSAIVLVGILNPPPGHGYLKLSIYTLPLSIFILSLLIVTYMTIAKKYQSAALVLLLASLLLSGTYTLLADFDSGTAMAAAYLPLAMAGILFRSHTITAAAAIVLILMLANIAYCIGPPYYPTIVDPARAQSYIHYPLSILALALCTWSTARQRELALDRAIAAEKIALNHKDALKNSLDRTSYELRTARQKEVQHLYKFAQIGQSTGAMIHELSNQLCILNSDLDNIPESLQNIQSLDSARDVTLQLNNLIHKARNRLSSIGAREEFKIGPVIRQAILDSKTKHPTRKLNIISTGLSGGASVLGDPDALLHIITILLDNALEASYGTKKPRVTIKSKSDHSFTYILVSDWGPGVDKDKIDNLFLPKPSSKSSGLGIGLYLASKLASSQLGGNLSYTRPKRTSTFTVKIPLTQESSKL